MHLEKTANIKRACYQEKYLAMQTSQDSLHGLTEALLGNNEPM
jgi:hypothetical protein